MKIALLKGNRYNPWHLRAYGLLKDECQFTAFRAESEIQRHMDLQNDGSASFPLEPIWFDTHAGNPLARVKNELMQRYGRREPRIVPFYERLGSFDLVHTWELFADWSEQAAIAKEKYGIPLVVMVWDNIVFNMEHPRYRLAIKKRVIEAADAFLVHTERSRRTLVIEGVPEDRITLFPPAVDTTAFAPGTRDRSAFGLSDDEFMVLYVGWLIPRKGVDFLLVALRELLADSAIRGTRVRLVLAGSPAHKPRVESLMNRLGVRDACTFLGPLRYEQMPALYRCADAFILPSVAFPDWQEQFGMSLIEAMASGVPSIAASSGAIPEMLGDCGIVCQPADFVSLHAAMRTLILDANERARLAQLGRERALSQFALSPHAERLREVYRRLCKGKRL